MVNRNSILHVFVVLGMFVCANLCLADELPPRIIAEVSGAEIDEYMFKQFLDVRPIPDYSKVDTEMVRGRLDELVTSEVLYAEAMRLGLDKQPNLRFRISQMLAQVLLEEKVNKPIYQSTITDKDIQTYYDKHIDEFKRSEQVRIADIFIAIDPEATKVEHDKKWQHAESLLTQAKMANGRIGFGKLILKYSDSPASYKNGDTGYFDSTGRPIGIDAAIVTEAFKLQNNGQVPDVVIRAADGYHIIMLSRRRPAIDKPLAKVKSQITRRIRREKIKAAHSQYIDALRSKSHITVNTDAVQKIAEHLNERIVPRRTATPGSFPALPPVMPRQTALSRGPLNDQ